MKTLIVGLLLVGFISIPATAIFGLKVKVNKTGAKEAISALISSMTENDNAQGSSFAKYFCREGDASSVVGSVVFFFKGKDKDKSSSTTKVSVRSAKGAACNEETIAALALSVCVGENPGEDAKNTFPHSLCAGYARDTLGLDRDADEEKVAKKTKEVLEQKRKDADPILQKLCSRLPKSVQKYACKQKSSMP